MAQICPVFNISRFLSARSAGTRHQAATTQGGTHLSTTVAQICPVFSTRSQVQVSVGRYVTMPAPPA